MTQCLGKRENDRARAVERWQSHALESELNGLILARLAKQSTFLLEPHANHIPKKGRRRRGLYFGGLWNLQATHRQNSEYVTFLATIDEVYSWLTGRTTANFPMLHPIPAAAKILVWLFSFLP